MKTHIKHAKDTRNAHKTHINYTWNTHETRIEDWNTHETYWGHMKHTPNTHQTHETHIKYTSNTYQSHMRLLPIFSHTPKYIFLSFSIFLLLLLLFLLSFAVVNISYQISTPIFLITFSFHLLTRRWRCCPTWCSVTYIWRASVKTLSYLSVKHPKK